MSSGTASAVQGTIASSGRSTRGNSSNARFARALDRAPASAFRNGSLRSGARLRGFRRRAR